MISGTSNKTERSIINLFILILSVVSAISAGASSTQKSIDKAEQIALGKRLFKENRFSSPEGDLVNSCSSCHLTTEDPQGLRVHTDFFNRSWVPWRKEDPRRSELRNSPTILDCALMPKLHFDGEFSSLESLVIGTLTGRPMGWVPGEAERASENVYKVIVNDSSRGDGETSYRESFQRAFGVDVTAARRNEVLDMVAGSIASYMRGLRSSRATPFDNFSKTNGLPVEPLSGESTKSFASRILAQISSLEMKKSLTLTSGFDATALAGYKIFLSTGSGVSSGNCASCHAPPLFTDLSFHNMGVSQAEYDMIHGDGSFSLLSIPEASEAHRPITGYREIPEKDREGWVDLGFWNYVDSKNSSLRRSTESEDQFLRRMIGTFKTPTLRNLAYSSPYLHNGSASSVESTIAEIRRLSDLARKGLIREPDEELARININDSDVRMLAAFLKTLNDDSRIVATNQ